MPTRFPLLARILVWFFLNLAMLAVVLVLLLRAEFRLDALIAGRGGERVQQLADLLVGELRDCPRDEWDAILQRFGESYGIRLLLFAPGEEQVAGEPTVRALSVWWWLPFVGGITRAVSQMTRATEHITEGRFDVNAPERRRDELSRLGAAINRMAGRLAGFVAGQKRFLGDVSHELCSPIARIQVALGILEQRANPKQKPYLDDLHDEVQQMSQLVNELPSFSKASFGEKYVQLAPVRVQDLIESAAKRKSSTATTIEIVTSGELWVRGDAELLRRALANLIRNAVRHAGKAGPIRVVVAPEKECVVIGIVDGGVGVPEADLAKIFDPFYRPDASRDRATGGVELGLSTVKSCIEACGGTVTCRNLQPHGFEVRVQLQPASAPTAS